MSGHSVIRCRHCLEVIMQCRCMSSEKTTEYGVCESCKAKGLS